VSAEQAAMSGDAPAIRATVLVVDDEPAVLESTAALLSDHHHVLTAGNGQDALALISAHDVDVICTDYNMPGMTGIELLRRATESHDHIAGVLVTGFREYVARDQRQAGTGYFLLFKPYDPRKLIECVEQVLSAFARLKRHTMPPGGPAPTSGKGKGR
jgi:YesN/AraC family two-component response regulator